LLEAILGWSIRHRFIVLLATLGLVVLGATSFHALPIDAFPDTTPTQVQVNTNAPTLGPLQIERQITAPVEQAISGLKGLSEVRSLSRSGLSQVTVVFDDGTDVYLARQLVAERVAGVSLPKGTPRPTLGPVATGLGEVFHYAVTGEGKSATELRTAQEWVIAPQMRSVAGVAEVNTWGGDERQIQIVVDPVALQARDLTIDQLAQVLERNNGTAGGGTLESGGEAYQIQGSGLIEDPKQIGEIVIRSERGVPLRVRDVARIVEGRVQKRGAVTEGGKGEIVLGLGFMLLGENSHDVTVRLAARLEEVKKSLPAGIRVEPLYARTDLVDRVLHTVRTNLLESALLVIAVLFAFLGSPRAGFLVALAIPLSMLFASSLMLRFGVAGSLMSLGAIDFGLVVDSTVIQVDSAMRHLGDADGSRKKEDVIRDAVIEVRKPTMFGELIIFIVYVPVLLLEGMEGKLFRPMALTMLFALFGSMVLSLTVIPALATFILPGKVRARDPLLVRGLRRGYRFLLGRVLRRPIIVLGLAVGVLVGGVSLAPLLGTELIPRLSEGALAINTIRLASVSLDESVRYGTRIEKALLEAFPDEIERVWTRTGTPEVATDPMGVELSDVFVTLKPRAGWKKADDQAGLVAKMEEVLSGFPGMRMVFAQPIEMRVNEMVAGVRSDVAVKLFGDDLDALKDKAREIEAVLNEVPGAADVTTEQVTGAPTLQVTVDRTAAARHGIATRDVLDVVEAMGGLTVGELQEGDRRFDIAIRIDDRHRHDVDAFRKIVVGGAGGDRVPLERVAKVELVEGPNTVSREWAKRRLVIQANVRGRDIGSFVRDAQAALDDKVRLPEGAYIRFGGQFEHFEAAQRRLLVVVPIALLLIFALLYATYGRVLDAARVFLGVPFAAVGGIVALHLRGIPFSVSAAVGFIAVFGVSVLGDMVLVSHVRQLEAQGVAIAEAVRQAADHRLRPVLMTALVAALGFIPMALAKDVGAEVQRPLATVVIGGVITSTLLTLFVLPALYLVVRKDVASRGTS
jgi:cobalt-zinc-cadmium resistance protein CzcA